MLLICQFCGTFSHKLLYSCINSSYFVQINFSFDIRFCYRKESMTPGTCLPYQKSNMENQKLRASPTSKAKNCSSSMKSTKLLREKRAQKNVKLESMKLKPKRLRLRKDKNQSWQKYKGDMRLKCNDKIRSFPKR